MKKELFQKYLSKGTQVTIHDTVATFEISEKDLLQTCEELISQGLHLKIITATDERKELDAFKLSYIFGDPKEHIFLAPFILVKNSFTSLTSTLHHASLYERKIYSLFGLIPQGHPNCRSLILHENWPESVFPLRKDFAWNKRPGIVDGKKFQFHEVGGEGVYEIPVGPVHAGIIEPGHFRFSVAGEEILHLEPRLGYSHKGTEKLFEVLGWEDKIRLAERISGDSSFSHSLAFCQALESLGQAEISENVKYYRVLFCELERLANHFGDMGAIMLDTGFNFGGAQGARLRELCMQMAYELSGSRFLRGVNGYGKIQARINYEALNRLGEWVEGIKKDFSEAMKVADNNSSLIERLVGTGKLSAGLAHDHGVVGVTARSLGFQVDTRRDFPYAAYDRLDFVVALEKTGDVHARFYVRLKEVYSSLELIKNCLAHITPLPLEEDNGKVPLLKKNAFAIGVVEGWRGEIIYVVMTDSKGMISRVDVRDPSFLNWTVLGHAGRGNMVPDFPLINKSFNLSYSGNDL